MVDDELVLGVHGVLDVVADGLLAGLTQGAGIGIGARELGLAAVLQVLDLGLLACLLRLELGELGIQGAGRAQVRRRAALLLVPRIEPLAVSVDVQLELLEILTPTASW
jgi:hypothetical protein